MLGRKSAMIAAVLLGASGAWAQDSATGGKQPEKKPEKQGEKAAATLSIGDRAPEMTVSKWVKGEAVTGYEKGRVYVVDCWATWCGPCIRAIPHMTEIQEKYKDKVTVIGLSVWEYDQGKIAPFVEGKGDVMAYRVAADDVPAYPDGIKPGTKEAQRWNIDNGKSSKGWMKAAGSKGIPTVFIIDQQARVAWIGHPMTGMDAALDKIVAGTWDIEAEKRAASLGPRVEKYKELLAAGETEQAYAIGRDLVAGPAKDSSRYLNEIAWSIIDPQANVAKKDLDLAHKAATRAVELTGSKDAAVLDTLALATFLKGDVAKAIELQTKAVEIAPAEMKAELEGRLAEFKAKK